MNIGVLGGTFDPIHHGHLLLARQAKEQFHLNKVLFVPTFIPPHKRERSDLAPADDRFAMVRLAVKSDPAFEVSRIELDRGDVSYTSDTVRFLHQQYAQDRLFLIIGADSFKELPTWRNCDEIRRLATLLVAPREDLATLKDSGQAVLRIEMPCCPISSTEIKSRLRTGESLSAMLPPEVEQYIRQKRLYAAEAP